MAKALHLITVSNDGKFELGDEAVAVLNAVKGPLGVCAVSGRARQVPLAGHAHCVSYHSLHEPASLTAHQQTLIVNRLQGKSFLLNKLAASDAGEGFCVSPSHRPCTKGIWIWSELIERKAPNGSTYHVVLLDTEGIDAFGACLPLAALHSAVLCS